MLAAIFIRAMEKWALPCASAPLRKCHTVRVSIALLFLVQLLLYVADARAGGPRFVAGTTYFNPSLTGQPVVWAGGAISYFLDQGDLGPSVDHALAADTVAAAAAAWNSVPTAAVSIRLTGSLREDVDGSNVYNDQGGLAMPPDIQTGATSTPLGIIFDFNGSVIDAFYGTDASSPADCVHFGVLSRVDNLSAEGNIVHALIFINGRCTGSSAQLRQIQFQLMRAFGRVLGLDWSQANDAILTSGIPPTERQLEGWPIMRPIDLDCGQLSVQCVPNPLALRADDNSALTRLYPVTAGNRGLFPGKVLSAPASLTIHGKISFRRGQGMQGVNVVARPIDMATGLPDDRFPVSSVSGFEFTGDRGGPVTGGKDPGGIDLSRFGSRDASIEGNYDLSGIVSTGGSAASDYEVSLEAVNPLYTGNESVGPYSLGSPQPSGILPRIILHNLSAGMSIRQDFAMADSAGDLQPGDSGTALAPGSITPSGEWSSRISTPGQTSWFGFHVQAGRHFTVEVQALDETGRSSENKVRPVLGIWNAIASVAVPPTLAAISPFNGANPGLSAIPVDTLSDGELLLAVADQRGDGRPDYSLHGRLLYLTSVSPTRLPLGGGIIHIEGTGFRPGLSVFLRSGASVTFPAILRETTPTSITAYVPPVAQPSGSLDLVVTDPATNGIAAIAAGIAYGDASNDTITSVLAPAEIVSVGVPQIWKVRVLASDQVTPVGGVPVYFTSDYGGATLAECKGNPCMVFTTGDGYGIVSVIPSRAGADRIQAALLNGTRLATEFVATGPPAIAALSPALFIAPDASWRWAPRVKVWAGADPAAEASVTWSGIGNSSIGSTDSQGIASVSLEVKPSPPGAIAFLNACQTGTASCVIIPVYTVHAETEILSAVSGTDQAITPNQSIAPLLIRLQAPGGQPIVAGSVTCTGLIRSWTPPCAPAHSCEQGRIISAIAQTSTSGADGAASFELSDLPSISLKLQGICSAGDSPPVPFQIEVQP